MEDKVLKFLKRALLLNLIVLGFAVGFGFGSGQFDYKAIISSKIEINDSCNYSELSEAINCLNINFTSWYKFNLNNTGLQLNETEFIEQGGVCTHATEWYQNKLDALGFRTQQISIKSMTKGIAGHRFLVAFTNEMDQYCIIDQYTYRCQGLGQ